MALAWYWGDWAVPERELDWVRFKLANVCWEGVSVAILVDGVGTVCKA